MLNIKVCGLTLRTYLLYNMGHRRRYECATNYGNFQFMQDPNFTVTSIVDWRVFHSLCQFIFQIQCSRVRPEPKLPRLLQAEQQEVATGNGSRQGVDVQDSVCPFRKCPWRCAGRLLPVRQHPQLDLQLGPLLPVADPRRLCLQALGPHLLPQSRTNVPRRAVQSNILPWH